VNRVPVLLLSLLTACGGVPATEFSGSVAGLDLGTAGTAYFGGPFLIFTDVELECMEAAWVTRYYDPQDPPPTDIDLVGLQITFNDDDVFTGRFDLGGVASLNARFIQIEGDTFEIWNAREGTLTVDELEEEEYASGTIDLDFGDDGALTADWATQWCVNVSE
jgi:hypothetical protein